MKKRVTTALAVLGVLVLLLALASPIWAQPTGVSGTETGLFKRLIAYNVDGTNPLYAYQEDAGMVMFQFQGGATSIVGRAESAADSGTTTDAMYLSGASPADTVGTNVHNYIRIGATVGNATGGTNSVRGIQVDNITGDAQVTETGINVGTGWDVALAANGVVNLAGGYGSTGCSVSDVGALQCDGGVTTAGALTADSLDVGGGYLAGSGSTLSAAGALSVNSDLTVDGNLIMTKVNAASGSANPFDWTGTAGIMNGTDDLTIVDINLTNANHGGVNNTIQGIDIGNITGDADATEDAIKIGTGWDSGLWVDSPVDVGGGFAPAATGCTLSTAGAIQCNDLAAFGGGYGDTGCSVSAAGVLQCNGAATTDSSITADSGVFGGGFGVTGCSISNAGAIQCNDQGVFGGGLGDTGATIGADGNISTDGTLTIVSTSDLRGTVANSTGNLGLADDVDMGGGYGTTGCSVANATGNLQCNGALTVDGASTLTGAATMTGGFIAGADSSLTADTTGGDKGAKTEFSGLVRMKLAGMVGGTDGTAASKTAVLMDDTPAGEYIDIDAHTTTTNDNTHYKAGVQALKTVYGASAVATDGTSYDTSGAAPDWTDDENVGGWLFCDKALAAGDLVYSITDDVAGETLVNIPALTVASKWTWVEVDITAVANASKDHIHAIGFELSAAGAAKVELNCWADAWYKWDQTEEDTLNATPILDGVTGVVNTVLGNQLAEYTDYFVDYTDGALVWISDQSAAVLFASVYY